MDRETIKTIWHNHWAVPFFKHKLIQANILWMIVLIAFPIFFNYIETREGANLNDPILALLPRYNVSIPIFLIIWSMSMVFLYRAIYAPKMLLLFMWGFIVLSLSRFITIYLVALNPPANLIPLMDPITNVFYGGTSHFITKDLFYSGHTSTQFLFFLCFTKKTDKILALTATCFIGVLVLIQHIHYSIDVIAAPIMCYGVYLISKRIVSN
jgi:hypothetical protein